MDKDGVETAHKIRFLILDRIGGIYLTAKYPDAPPMLGPDYENALKNVFAGMDQIRLTINSELGVLSDDDLAVHFSDSGQPKSETWKTWLKEHRYIIGEKSRHLSEWHVAAFGDTKFVANYEYWAKSPFLTLDEALWLSVGLESQRTFQEKISDRHSYRAGSSAVADHMKSRHELFRRELDRYNHIRHHDPKVILEWINRVELDVHDGFRKMLELMIRRAGTAKDAVPDKSDARVEPEGTFDNREEASLAKLLLAMAITEYGYDPDARRSPIPKEMQNVAAKLGLSVSPDTIRQYLQIGARHLPKGWRPDS